MLAFVIELSKGGSITNFLVYSALFIALLLLLLPKLANRFFMRNSRRAYELPFVFMCLAGFVAIAEGCQTY